MTYQQQIMQHVNLIDYDAWIYYESLEWQEAFGGSNSIVDEIVTTKEEKARLEI